MALDKLVDSTKLDACLDAEADAIRAKTGDSNDISFDFANNKGFADAIAAIPSGGGLPALISEIECGDIQVASATVSLVVQTSLQNAPDFIIIFVKERWQRSYNSASGKFIIYSQFNFARTQGQPNSMNYGTNIHQASITINFSGGNITFKNSLGLAPKFSPTQIVDSEGTTEPISYRWIAGRFVNGGGS